MVAAADEAHVLALGAARRLQPGPPGLGARLHLGLLAQRKPAPREDLARDGRQHVRLVLGRIRAPGDQGDPVAAAHARVVPGGDARRPDPVGERREGGEPERAVAAHARVGRAPGLESGHELLDHLVVEAGAQVEADVRHAHGVAGVPRGPHRPGRAAGALAVGRARVDPQPQGDPDRLEPGLDRLEQRDRRVHAAGHRHGHPALGEGSDAESRAVASAACRASTASSTHSRFCSRGSSTASRSEHADAGGAEQVAPLGQRARELGGRGRVRAPERAVPRRGDGAAGHRELDPDRIAARASARLARDGAGAGRTGMAQRQGVLDGGGGVHGRSALGRDRLQAHPRAAARRSCGTRPQTRPPRRRVVCRPSETRTTLRESWADMPWASSTWLGSASPAAHAEPAATAYPSRSRASTSRSARIPGTSASRWPGSRSAPAETTLM